MPEYKCECCDFKTIDKGKYFKHNETKKHLKKMETYVKPEPVKQEPVKPEPVKQEPVKEEPDLKEKVSMLEKTIEILIKRIEVLENNQVEKPADEPQPLGVIESNEDVEPNEDGLPLPVDVDDIIHHIEHETFIDLEPYTKNNTIDWDNYVKEQLDEDIHLKMKNEKVPYEILKETYDENSEKAIFKKMCKLIPKDTIKIKDVSRGKFYIFCEGKWLNQVEATEKLEKMIDTLQRHITNLHIIYATCDELYRGCGSVFCENYSNYSEKVCQGNAIKKSIVKSILEYYKD